MNRPAPTVATLIQEVNSDPVVLDRYLRHYAINRDELMKYFSGLHPARLGKPYRTAMYSVPENGQVKVHFETLKTGERVFVNAMGIPILRAVCGNPLTLGPGNAMASNIAPNLGSAVAMQLHSLTPDVAQPDELPPNAVAYEPKLVDDTIQPPVENKIPNSTRPQVFGPVAGNSGLLGALLSGGAIFGLASHGGSTPPPAVPEPSVVALLGFSALALLKRKKH